MLESEPAATPVLIVGAGPVGLALAGDLGWRGINCILVEQSDGSIYQPRMDLVGVRTMEFCRRWGIVDDVEASPYPRDYPQDNVYLTSLTGFELGRERFPSMDEALPPPQSPQKRERCPQNMFDPILQRFALSFDTVQIRYRTKLKNFEQDGAGVTAVLENCETGDLYKVRAAYLVGCDGAHSAVRQTLGIAMQGKPVLSRTTNVIFRCPDLVPLHDKGRAYRHIFIGPEGTWATIVAINGRDEWRLSVVNNLGKEKLSEADIQDCIRRTVGVDFEYEVLSILPWTRQELVAERYNTGRGFIAGDAAHVMSPTGGFGMNTGIGDAVDLSWKLAAVLEGWAAPALLGSYGIERRPVGLRNVSEASANLQRMLSPGHEPSLLDDTDEGARAREQVGRDFSAAMRNEWYTLGIHLGYRYDNSPVCWHDDTPPPPDQTSNYEQTTRPGSRAPHAWLEDGRSTLDLFGRTFVLLRLGTNAPEADTLVDAAGSRGIPMNVHHIIDADTVRLYERSLVLVRPDGHVAWRNDAPPDDPGAVMDRVTGAATGQRSCKAPARTCARDGV